MSQRVAIVYGSRRLRLGQYSATSWLRTTLREHGITTVRHGDCSGIDRDSGRIAKQAGFQVDAMPADWAGEKRRTGRSGPAGPKRNQAMADKDPRPVLGIEFPGDKGTAGMHRILERAGVPIIKAPFTVHDGCMLAHDEAPW